MTEIKKDVVVRFRCNLCFKWKGLAAHHPHPHFEGLCRYCVKPMRNKVHSHNKRMWKNHPNVDSKNIRGISASEWVSVLRQHDFCCAGCGVKSTKKTILTLDHIYPLALGGMNRPHNVQPLCEQCHRQKDLAPTVMPWELETVTKKAAKTAKRKKTRKKDYRFFKDLGIFPSSEWFKKVKSNYHKDEEFRFYDSLHNYIIERLLIYWLNKTMGEKRLHACESFDQAA